MVSDPILVRGYTGRVSQQRPVLLQRTDQEFIPALLDELQSEPGRQRLSQTVIADGSGNDVFKLFQPVHRTFHVVLVDVACETLMFPRVDPTRIDSAGMVLRRHGQRGVEGWLQAGKRFRGWVPLNRTSKLDPDPARRPPVLDAGHPLINRELALEIGTAEPLSEATSPLFIAPPAACQSAKRTVLYGLVPLTSAELSESPTVETFTDDDLVNQVHHFLHKGPSRALPSPGSRLDSLLGPRNVAGPHDDLATGPGPFREDPSQARLQDFTRFLQQLAIQFDVFGATPAARALFAALNAISLEYNDGQRRPAGEFVRDAVAVLLDRHPTAQQAAAVVPKQWPAISTAQADAFARLIRAALQTRLSRVAAGQGRFDDPEQQYHLRPFVRLKSTDGCPPRLVWGERSNRFKILPWYESSDAPPVQVRLPNVADRPLLKSLKPNVAFVMPQSVFDLARGKPKDMLDGKFGSASGGIEWICSFSIPIITLCAFIVLNIFLSLFDLIFNWMLYIKICLPLPKK